MERIIKTNNEISVLDYANIETFFANCIGESIAALDSSSTDYVEYLNWYEDCTIEDYFTEMPDLWTDSGEHLGEGFNMIFAKILYNKDTAKTLNRLFESARDKEYNAALTEYNETK